LYRGHRFRDVRSPYVFRGPTSKGRGEERKRRGGEGKERRGRKRRGGQSRGEKVGGREFVVCPRKKEEK